jgi:amidase
MVKVLRFLTFVAASLLGSQFAYSAQKSFSLIEATIAAVHDALISGSITCENLTRDYIDRIQIYDQSTGLNSIIMINPEALIEAKELDEEFAKSSNLKPLHCVPLVVKDNYNTRGLQTTAGSKAMFGFIPKKDAFIVARLKEAGALVLAKSNMAEWAFSPRVTISSVSGETRNPYNLDHVPAGSSGGTGAAVAANLGLIGLGTDTGNSIRGPSSHNALVGIRSTLGLTSRSGIVPLYFRNDVGGPMARTVTDAVRVLQVISGPDPLDSMTRYSQGKVQPDLISLLNRQALRGKRIGVLRQLSERDHDPKIADLFAESLNDLERLGATIIDPVEVPGFDEISSNHWCRMFKQDLNAFLKDNASAAPVNNIKEIIDSGLFSDYIAEDLEAMQAVDDPTNNGQLCQDHMHDKRRIIFRDAIVKAMDNAGVNAIVYPSWNFPPARIGHPADYRGDSSQVIAPHTGLPAVTVPMGYVNGLPAGLHFVGRLFSEADLLPLVYAYEQGTLHRKSPAGFDELDVPAIN